MRVAIAAVALILGSCACTNPPAGNVTAFFAGGQPSRDVVATVAAITPMDIGGFRYDMRDGARLTWIAKEPIAALQAGGTYRIVVEYAPGSPDTSGILVFDGERLLFAALSDHRLFQHVLEAGIPGFTIATGEPSCASRGRTKCHESLVNLPLTVEHAGERKVLFQGQSEPLGDFAVDALVAQKVTHRPRCADAGLPGVCFVIRRVR